MLQIRNLVAEEPSMAREILTDSAGCLRRYKRTIAEWGAPHLHHRDETEYLELRLKAILDALPRAGTECSGRISSD